VFEQIGDGNVAVPTHVFKLVVGEGSDGELKAIAFVAENKKPTNGWRFADGIVSIDWLELRSGLNFMPELDPSDEVALEASTSPIWGQ
jgi:endonuclease G